MYKKLFIAPLALTLALSAVSPNFAYAEEGVTEETPAQVETKDLFEDAGQLTSFDLIYNGKSSDYKNMFRTTAIKKLDDGQYQITLEVPDMLTTFEIDGKTPKVIGQTSGNKVTYNVYQFTIDDVKNIPLYIEYTVQITPTKTHVGKYNMTIVMDYSEVTPVISYAGVATSNYDKSFTNVAYVKAGDKYKVTMNVDKLFTTFKVNGENVALTADGDKQKAEFLLDDINSNPLITIGYSVNGNNVSHDFKFDFTPSIAEVEADIENALAALSYTSDEKIIDETSYKAAIKELGYIDAASKYKVDAASVTVDIISNDNYVKQQAAIDTYVKKHTDQVQEAIDKLSYVELTTIKTIADIKAAKEQIEVVNTAIANAKTAGLDEQTHILTRNHYANIALQQKAVSLYKEAVSTDTAAIKATVTVPTDVTEEKAKEITTIFEQVIPAAVQPSIELDEEAGRFNITVPFNITNDIKEIWINGVKVYPAAPAAKAASVKAKAMPTTISFATESLEENEIIIKKSKLNADGEEVKNEAGEIELEDYTAQSSFVVSEKAEEPEVPVVPEENNPGNTGNTGTTPEEKPTTEETAKSLNYQVYYKDKVSSYGDMFGAATSKKLANGEYEVTLQVPTMLSKFTVNGVIPEHVSTSGDYNIVKFTIPTLTSKVMTHVEYTVAGHAGSYDMEFAFGESSSGAGSDNNSTETDTKEPEDQTPPTETPVEAGTYTAEMQLADATGEVASYLAPEANPAVVAKDGEYEVTLPIANINDIQTIEMNGEVIYSQTAVQKLSKSVTSLAAKDITFSTKKLAGNELVITTTDGKKHSAKLSLTNVAESTKPTTPETDEKESAEEAQSLSYQVFYNGKVSSYGDMFGAATSKKLANGEYEVTLQVPTMLAKFTVNGVTPEHVSTSGDYNIVKFTIPTLTSKVMTHVEYTVSGHVGSYDMEFAFGGASEGTGTEETPTDTGSTNPPTTENTENTENNETKPEDKEVAEEAQSLSYQVFYNGKVSSYGDMFGAATSKKLANGEYEVTLEVPTMLSKFTVNGTTPERISTTGNYHVVKFTMPSLTSKVMTHVEYTVSGHVGSYDMEFAFGGASGGTGTINPPTTETEKPSTETPAETPLAAGDYTANVQLTDANGDISAYVLATTVPTIVSKDGQYNVTLPIANSNAVQKVEVNGSVVYSATTLQRLTKLFTASASKDITFSTKKLADNAIVITTTDGKKHSAKLSLTNVKAVEKVTDNETKPGTDQPTTETPVTQTTSPTKVKVSNKKGAADIVKVYGAKKGDTVRVYNAKGKVIAQAVAKTSLQRFEKISVGKAAGTLSVTLQADGQQESTKTTVSFKQEPISAKVKASSITVKNNKGKNDVVTVKGTAKGEKVRVYDANGKTLKTVTATTQTTKISIKQLGKKAGKIQVARIQAGKHISTKTMKNFTKES